MPFANERESSARASTDDQGQPRGETYDAELDRKRLGAQLQRVRDFMLEARGGWREGWRTLSMIAAATGYPEASVSARLRDLRRPACGGLTVERRRRGEGGLHEYRVSPPEVGQ